jgi:hypothetical protein
VAVDDDFQKAFETLVTWLETMQASFSEREKTIFQIGLRLSHAEEAVAHGETDRAREHWKKIVELSAQLGTMGPAP